MPIYITDLLDRVEPATERIVNDTRLRFNQSIRRVLRDETRLQLSAGGTDGGEERETHAVRVTVTAGYPAELNGKSVDDDLRLALLLAPLTRLLSEAHMGMASLIPPVQRLYDHQPFTDMFADVGPKLEAARESLAEMLKETSKANLLTQIFQIREDVLGAYFYERSTQGGKGHIDDGTSRIELFWGVIGLVSKLLGVSVAALTVKVLAHELAHAYTHRGADADGRRWDSAGLRNAERALKEGLAQYYTYRVLERLGKQAPDAMDAYERLLPHQPEIYRTHLNWVKDRSQEEVRDAMLTIRCRASGTVGEFESLLAETRTRRQYR